MKHSEVSRLLGFMGMFDKRQTNGDADVIAWTDILPPDLTLELAVAAVRKFYATPAEAQYDPVLTSRQLLRYVRLVKAEQRTQERRQAAVEATRKAAQLGRSKAPLQIGGLGIRLKAPDDI